MLSESFRSLRLFPSKSERRPSRLLSTIFQAQKFHDKGHAEEIRKASSPMTAARLGRDRRVPLRKDWESVKIGVMRQALLAKFTQHQELKDLLLSTGTRQLIESTANDDYWGDGGNGSGKNMLGRLLMAIRSELNYEA
jgi:ribA/ribD-fused uncharacterized protein